MHPSRQSKTAIRAQQEDSGTGRPILVACRQAASTPGPGWGAPNMPVKPAVPDSGHRTKAFAVPQDAAEGFQEVHCFDRRLIDQLPIGLALCRMDGVFLEFNPEFARILGRPAQEVRSISYWDVTPPEYVETERRLLAQLPTAGRYGPYEKEYLRPDGSRIPVRLQGLLVERDGEQLIWSSVEDISGRVAAERQRHLLENQLRQAQKMEAIGTLAGGIAHDFNNILASVIGYGELALLRSEEGSPLRDYVGEILQAGIRAKGLVQQILAFSRQGEQDLQPVKVSLIVREALKLLRPSLPSTIEVRQRVQSNACVMADPTRVHQILMNLCTNAEHAMRASGGVLEIGLREALIAPEDARRLAGLEAGRYLVLSVSDSGCGIPPDTRERIFEPFFTTKPKGEGTGLGLSVVHGIVESCRGCIEVDSELGRGSRFSVYLPVVAEEDEAVPELPVTSSVRGNGHILLVDDEPALLRAMSLFLEVQGYRVSALTQSSLALERFQAEPDSFDLIITDLTMPKMDGKRLTDRARAIRPDIPVILCSGYAHTLGEGAIAAMGINAFIRKPILRSQMIGTVLQVLQTAAGANASKTP